MQTEKSETDEHNDGKRKRSEQSSTSEIETTLDTSEKLTKTKRKSKMAKAAPTIDEFFPNANEGKQNKELKDIRQQLKEVNTKLTSVINKVDRSDKKLEDVVMKSDGTLRSILREMITEMKEDLLNSIVNRLEILESKVYDRDTKAEELKAEVTRLEKDATECKKENEKLRRIIHQSEEKMGKFRNDTEQYSRLNNIRIHGMVSGNAFENAEETTNVVIRTLNEKLNMNLGKADIDVAHRMKAVRNGSQEAIVKLQSRLVKESILRNRKALKGTGIFINEDLTQLNQQVFMSVKKKLPGEVSSVFSRNGVIKYVTRNNEVKPVLYQDYQRWLDLPWPNSGATPNTGTPPNRGTPPIQHRMQTIARNER